ncbi:MAG: SpoIID/LytB domain-containing protein [Actinobacteria bacterium]|nr:SpoIID/LytB domain-containing protein [Actinomycetota bacterium]
MTVRRLVVAPFVVAALLAATALAPSVSAEDAPVDPTAPPASFPVVGAGFGHGVGMSQWGAYGMAKAGFDAAGIVTHYYTGTNVTPVQDDMDARINLLNQVSSVKARSEPLDPTGGAVEVTIGPVVVVGGPADEFRFALDGANVSVQKVTGAEKTDLGVAPTVTVRWAGTRAPGTAVGGATLLDVGGPNTSLDSPGHRYRYGFLEVVPVLTSAGMRLNAVNVVRIHDEYLYGISEVSSSWPGAALQAQVLAARSYALSKVARGVRQGCSCHMDDGGGPYYDQTFTGWGKASAAQGQNWVDAVNATIASETTGLAVLFDGKPISAFYSASSGGATQSVKDVWGGDLPYAVSVPDPYMQVDANPYRSWTVEVSQSQMAKVFGVGAVVKVEVTERLTSGAIRTVSGTAADGSVVTRSGGQFQSALGLRSYYVLTIGGAPGAPLPGAAPAPAPAAPAPAPVAVPAPAPAPAPVPTVTPRVVSLLTPSAVTTKAGKRYKVVGVVRPAKARLQAWRQSLVDGQWKTMQTTTTSAKGRYRFVIKKAKRPGTTGTFRVLVVKKGAVVGVSPQFTVTVRR